MKKIISQISLISLIILIGMTSVFIPQVNADSKASLNISAAKEGENFTVSLGLPANIIDAEATITVTYSDQSTATARLVYSEGNSSFPNSVSFSAKVPGNAVVKATGIILSDNSPVPVIVEEGGTTEKTITIVAKNPEPTPEPEPTPTPTPDPTPATNTSSSGNTTQTPANTTTNNTTNTNTTKEPEIVNPTFKDVNETVYALKGCNVRSSCSTAISSNKIGGLVKGQSVTRIGYDKEWSKISYNGKTAYVATSLLTTEKPEEEEENVVNNTVENTIENEVSNEIVNETVDKNEILKNIENEIGVLPEVGTNIADYMFFIVTFITLLIIMYVNYNLKNKEL